MKRHVHTRAVHGSRTRTCTGHGASCVTGRAGAETRWTGVGCGVEESRSEGWGGGGIGGGGIPLTGG